MQYPEYSIREFTLFNCSYNDYNSEGYSAYPITCLSSQGYQVLALSSDSDVRDFTLSSCTKVYNISDVPLVVIDGSGEKWYQLEWLKPSSGDCEAQGKYCRLKNNGTDDETEYFGIPTQPRKELKTFAVVIGTPFLLLAIFIVSYHSIRLKKKKEDQKKIETFLDDYKALRPTRFSYADIKKITDQFKDKLGEGGYGTIYKGHLSNDSHVTVKVVNNFKGNSEEFINEVGTIGTIDHINVVRLVGYCTDAYRRALLYEFLPNDSLEKLISSTRQIKSLGWQKLQQIAIGIAKGLDYLHQGCNQRILHFDIKLLEFSSKSADVFV